MPQYSKNAFNCAKCPGTGGEGGCPAWWEVIETNANGEERINRGCGFAMLPTFLIEVIKASNRPAAAVESTRNEIAQGFARLATISSMGLPLLIEEDT